MTNKKIITLRYWLLGKDYHMALGALEYAAAFHTGTRKDGHTPEYDHQLIIAGFVRSISNLLEHPEDTIAAAFLHDVCEDYDVGFEEIDKRFGPQVRDAVVCLTKKHRGAKLDTATYYNRLGDNRIASIVKGIDRMHNMQTMSSVFSEQKQASYISETEDFILPMLKRARRQFTKQEPVYEMIKLVLNSQIDLIKLSLT